jgi:hypothetical protein
VAQLIATDIDRQLAGPNKPLREDLPPAPDDVDVWTISTKGAEAID